jgi:hypothetical protein
MNFLKNFAASELAMLYGDCPVAVVVVWKQQLHGKRYLVQQARAAGVCNGSRCALVAAPGLTAAHDGGGGCMGVTSVLCNACYMMDLWLFITAFARCHVRVMRRQVQLAVCGQVA